MAAQPSFFASKGAPSSSSFAAAPLSLVGEQADEVSAVTEPSVLMPASKKAPMPKKRGNEFIRLQYTITLCEGGPLQNIVCTHCGKAYVWKDFNASRACAHTAMCSKAPDELKEQVSQSTQDAKRKQRFAATSIISSDGTLSSESPAAMVAAREAAAALSSKKPRTESSLPRIQSSLKNIVTTLTPETANRILCIEIEQILYRFEPLSRLLCPMTQRRLSHFHGSRISRYIPSTMQELYSRFVIPIDHLASKLLRDMLQRMPGTTTMAVDGVTANGRSHLLYTASKGDVSVFVKLSQLRSLVHCTDAEVEDGVAVLEKIRKDYGSPVTNSAVDNAAKAVMDETCKKYEELHPSEPKILQTRDPAHCIDLLPKDCGKIMNENSPYGFGHLLKDTQDLIALLTVDKVAGIIQDCKQRGELPKDMPKPVNYSDTRMNKAASMFKSIQGNKPFFDKARSLKAFTDYYIGSNASRKASIDKQLELATSKYFERLVIAINWFEAFEEGYSIVSSNDTPMSAYLPTVQAIRNQLNKALKNEGGRNYETLFSKESLVEIASFIRVRFNMDGSAPEGTRRVGLLDPYQIWAYMVDPYRNELEHSIAIKPSFANQAHAATSFWCGSNVDERKSLKLLFNEYMSRQGIWIDLFHDESAKEILPPDKADKAQQLLMLQDVRLWLKNTGGHQSRLQFFQMIPPNLCFQKILLPLLSMRSTGSISVERAAKPFKVEILSGKRSNLDVANAELLLRAGLNLRVLLLHRKDSKSALIGNSWNSKKSPPHSSVASSTAAASHIDLCDDEIED